MNPTQAGEAVKVDFDALRAERNKQFDKFVEEIKADGWEISRPYDYNACYCACGTGGPCEHCWNGPDFTSADGCMTSSTCSRCGLTAFSHDLRNAP